MAESIYDHDNEKITIHNRHWKCYSINARTQRFKMPKGSWEKKLKALNKFLDHKWDIESTDTASLQWMYQINDVLIPPNDLNRFEHILSSIPPPLEINIINIVKSASSFFLVLLSLIHKLQKIWTIKNKTNRRTAIKM